MPSIKRFLPVAIVLLAVTVAYANHFHNSFHFDDYHTVVDNPAIRSLGNIPRVFTNTSTFSVLPANRTYRPMVSLSLALDYAMGGGYHPFWFHLSTFLVFLVQLIAMHGLFLAILKASRPDPEASSTNRWAALFAVAWYGLHPAMAETVNYIIQRGDIFCACGVVAALAIYARLPALRKTGAYLLPLAFALLSKPPAVVFPILLFAYSAMFEGDARGRYKKAALNALPALFVAIGLMALQSAMTPKSYTPSLLSAFAYRITQPYVLLRYFGALFLPVHLNVDTDLPAFSSVNAFVILGFIFVSLLLVVTWWTARKTTLRPISFGLLFFLVASLPTSIYPLSEVENDHRMFFPFVGLVLAVVWAGTLLIEQVQARVKLPRMGRITVAAACIFLACYGCGVCQRNRVWQSEESLWLDDVIKSPANGRGLMNYGLSQMAKGAYPTALEYFERALQYTPNYPYLEINLGIVNGAMHRADLAEQHFQRAIALAPTSEDTHGYYGRWLQQAGRVGDAVRELKLAIQLNPDRLGNYDLLAQAYMDSADLENARSTASAALRLDANDATARAILTQPLAQTADYWINASLYQFQSGNYQQSIDAARHALQLKPDLAVAYNNIGAAYAGLKQWNLAIQSEEEALRLQPDLQIAKNNLAEYARQKEGSSAPPATPTTAEDWLNASLRDYQAGDFNKSIQDARKALELRPEFAEAYNNIAASYASMGKWDEAITAAQNAIRVKPDFQLAKNNLAWAASQKKSGTK